MIKLFKKSQKKEKAGTPKLEEKLVVFQEKPRMILFDFDPIVKQTLEEKGFNIAPGSLGTPVEVPKKERHSVHQCLLNFEIPANLHEFDIVILDLIRKKPIPYKIEEHDFKFIQGSSKVSLLSTYPETLFNPQPLSASFILSELNQILKRSGIIIVFASEFLSIEYKKMAIKFDDTKTEEIKESNYSFSTHIPIKGNKSGKEMIVDDRAGRFSEILNNYAKNAKYEIIFEHPTVYDQINRTWNPVEDFKPLMKNKDSEIISFCRFVGNGVILVFPQIENKGAFLEELLNNTLPSIFPLLFPYHTQFLWLKSEDYFLPHETELRQKKEDVIKKFDLDIQTIDEEIFKNHEKYECLHHMLTDSSGELVKSIEKYLKWLGFEIIRNMDEINPGQREEDLQIDIDSKLLVIEIKGLGGTSTDSECSQINKIKFRRAEERGNFDVNALYIVNHQRFLPPLSRENPPFKANQIRDAINERRGLLTTWQLFKLYYMVKNNIISKEEARVSILDYGFIEFSPRNCISFGQPEHIYQEGFVFVIKVKTPVAVNDKLIIKRKDDYLSATIIELQDKNKLINSALDGMTVGIKTDCWIRKTDEILKKQ